MNDTHNLSEIPVIDETLLTPIVKILTALTSGFYMRRKIKKILQARKIEDVMEKWTPLDYLNPDIQKTLNIIRSIMDYPNTFFFPEDKLPYICCLDTLTLDSVEVFLDIEKAFNIKLDEEPIDTLRDLIFQILQKIA